MFEKLAKYVETVHEAELTLQELMKIEKFAAQVAQIHALHSWQDGGATMLPDLLLAPLRQITCYDMLTRALYDATPPEDFKERRRLQYVVLWFLLLLVFFFEKRHFLYGYRPILKRISGTLDKLMARADTAAQETELIQLERQLDGYPLAKLAMPGRRIMLAAQLQVSYRRPPKWKPMYVVLMNDLLLLAKQRAGEPVSYRYGTALCFRCVCVCVLLTLILPQNITWTWPTCLSTTPLTIKVVPSKWSIALFFSWSTNDDNNSPFIGLFFLKKSLLLF